MPTTTIDRVRRAVMELSVVHQGFDAEHPWSKLYPATRHAQAAVIEGPYLLTSAQMVLGATLIEVQPEGRPPRVPARVVHRDLELNLALLTVDEPGFFDDVQPLPLAPETPTGGRLATVRWRNQQFESAATRIKRMEVREVYYGRMRHAFLLGQTDLTGGGWAEPVIADGHLVGIASSQDDHTASIVPVEILQSYVTLATRPGPYPGFPALRFSWDWNIDAALAGWLGQEGPQEGVLIWHVPKGSTGAGVLAPRDLLLELDGHAIDANGYYRHPRFGRLELHHLAMDGHEVGDVVTARVLRDREERELAFPLRSYANLVDLIPGRRRDAPPPYAVVAGLVFMELDGDYLRTWGKDWWEEAPVRLVAPFLLEEGRQEPGRRRIVLLSQVLPSSWTLGYQELKDLIVERINGLPIHGIADVVQAFSSPVGSFHQVEFRPNPVRQQLVLDAGTLAEATGQVLRAYDIPAAYRLPAPPPSL